MSDIDYQAISKGDQAKTLMESAIFNEAFDTLEASLLEAVLTLPIEADAQRLRVVAMHKATQQVRQILSNHVAGASIERAQILENERKAGMFQRIKEIVRNV